MECVPGGHWIFQAVTMPAFVWHCVNGPDVRLMHIPCLHDNKWNKLIYHCPQPTFWLQWVLSRNWPRPNCHGNYRAANIGWGFGVRNARAIRCQPIKSQNSWWGGGDSDTFFSDLKNLASILQAHTCTCSRGTLRTSQTSDKPFLPWDISISAWERELAAL